MLLEEFFERKKTWEYVIYNMLAFIFIGISMLIWIMPYQVWQAEDEPVFWILFGFMEVIGLDCYLQKFTTYKDNGQIKQIDELMKYLPVSHKQIVRYRQKKLAKICVWLTCISMVCQTVFATILLHTFSIGNILIPLAFNFILPLLPEKGR